MSTDVRELSGARWVSQGTRLMAGLYVWLCLWLVLWVALPAILLPWSPLVITSGSMGPLINRGDVVLGTSDGLDTVAPGQVVSFHRDGIATNQLVTHRVYAVDGDGGFITQGDANEDADSYRLQPDEIVSRGRLLIPYAGLPLLWLRESPLVFLAWLALTSVAVALARAGMPKTEDLVDEDGRPVFEPGSGWWRPVDVVLGLVEGRPRPVPGRVRAWTPTVVTAVACAVLARDAVGIAMSVVVVIGVLLADPRGPHIPVGRVLSAVADFRAVLTERMMPRVREQQGAFSMLPVVAVVAMGLITGNSGAVFTGAVVAPANVVGSGIWDCTTPGPQDVPITADGHVLEGLPVSVTGALQLLVDGDKPRARGYLVVDLTPPLGCEAVAATLQLQSAAPSSGASFSVAGTTDTFDLAAMIWSNQPASGAATVATDTPGPIAVDVTTQVQNQATGLVIFMTSEDGDLDLDDGDKTAILFSSLEGPQAPTLIVDWQTP